MHHRRVDTGQGWILKAIIKQAFQHAAQSGESSSPDPVLNIVINLYEKAQ